MKNRELEVKYINKVGGNIYNQDIEVIDHKFTSTTFFRGIFLMFLIIHKIIMTFLTFQIGTLQYLLYVLLSQLNQFNYHNINIYLYNMVNGHYKLKMKILRVSIEHYEPRPRSRRIRQAHDPDAQHESAQGDQGGGCHQLLVAAPLQGPQDHDRPLKYVV